MDLLPQSKSETFDKFKEFKALIENQTSRHIRILRSDNEGEYDSNEFDDFCKEAWIKKELTVPYNPQQNGVAERKNITICEAAKAMLTGLDLVLSLWAEAACIAVHIQNRILLILEKSQVSTVGILPNNSSQLDHLSFSVGNPFG